jgi:hypothetical protein
MHTPFHFSPDASHIWPPVEFGQMRVLPNAPAAAIRAKLCRNAPTSSKEHGTTGAWVAVEIYLSGALRSILRSGGRINIGTETDRDGNIAEGCGVFSTRIEPQPKDAAMFRASFEVWLDDILISAHSLDKRLAELQGSLSEEHAGHRGPKGHEDSVSFADLFGIDAPRLYATIRGDDKGVPDINLKTLIAP